MELINPKYRTDYVGETINTVRDGKTISYFVNPRDNIFIPSNVDSAIVLGNGITRGNPQVQNLIGANANKVGASYKLVYACNRAISDPITYDYYVLKHRVFLAETPLTRLNQVYLPYDAFLDYKDTCNLLPYVSHLDSGASAAYLSAFDGHKKVFLFGFDGYIGTWRTMYDGRFPYENGDTNIDYKVWDDFMYNVISVYKDTQFYRIQLDGQEAPDRWQALPNFQDVTIRQAVLLGDF